MQRLLLLFFLVLFMICLINVNTALSVDKKDLVAFWSFNKGSGQTVADESGNKFDGKVIDAVWEKAGKRGSAMAFNGQGNYVEVASNEGLDPGKDNWTIELWLKRADAGTDWQKILTKYPCCNYTGYRVGLLNHAVHVIFGIGPPPNCVEMTSNTKITDQEWHHLAVVVDRKSDVIIYIDGKPDDNKKSIKQIDGQEVITQQNLEIGRCHWCGGGKTMGFNGILDEIKIWRSALNQNEVTTAMEGKLALAVSGKNATTACWGEIKQTR